METVYHKDIGVFEEVKVYRYPSLFPVTPRSFDVMEMDAIEVPRGIQTTARRGEEGGEAAKLLRD